MINCVIIEDEPLAQLGLKKLLAAFPSCSILAICDNILDFQTFRETEKGKTIDLIFLDIELPGTSGIHFLREKNLDIPVILTTAYSHYAMEGYELNVLDYLLKPISKERFNQSIHKAEQYINYISAKTYYSNDFIFIRSEKVIEKIFLNELILVEAMRNYVIYHCEKRKLICYNSLKNAEQDLPSQFIKIQKSFIVNKTKIEKIEKGVVTIHNRAITLNRENRSEIIKRLTEK